MVIFTSGSIRRETVRSDWKGSISYSPWYGLILENMHMHTRYITFEVIFDSGSIRTGYRFELCILYIGMRGLILVHHINIIPLSSGSGLVKIPADVKGGLAELAI